MIDHEECLKLAASSMQEAREHLLSGRLDEGGRGIEDAWQFMHSGAKHLPPDAVIPIERHFKTVTGMLSKLNETRAAQWVAEGERHFATCEYRRAKEALEKAGAIVHLLKRRRSL